MTDWTPKVREALQTLKPRCAYRFDALSGQVRSRMWRQGLLRFTGFCDPSDGMGLFALTESGEEEQSKL